MEATAPGAAGEEFGGMAGLAKREPRRKGAAAGPGEGRRRPGASGGGPKHTASARTAPRRAARAVGEPRQHALHKNPQEARPAGLDAASPGSLESRIPTFGADVLDASSCRPSHDMSA
ncbi:Exonuclease SbcC [Burkholderia gladioli]|nr:Exonuclease SbcC [Burkholderia gladioli]